VGVGMNSASIVDRVGAAIAHKRRLLIAGPLTFGTLALLPLLGLNNYLLHIAVLVFVYVALGLGLNIVVGLAGLLDLGYVAFYAVGAYSYALLSIRYHIPFPLAVIIGAGLAALIGVILGWPTIRARGDYLALVTLGFGEMVRLLIRNADSLTNGPRGLMNVPPPSLAGAVFSTPTNYYYLGLLLAAVVLTIFWRVKQSAAGQQLVAIRDDEHAAAAIGINPVRWKLYAFALGAFVAGLAGVFFASWQSFVSPESFTLGESILILSIVVLGGMGRLWPTVGAAAFLVLLPEALRGLQIYRVLVLGIILVLVVVLQERVRLRAADRRQKEPKGAIAEAAGVPDPNAASGASRRPHGDIILSMTDVRKSFGGISALNGVSFQMRKGEMVGLVGVNGAGKTTLFSCITGAVSPDSGKIELFRETDCSVLTGPPAYLSARQGIIRTFQQPRLFPSLTAVENVQLGARCRDIPSMWEPFLPLRDGQSAAYAGAVRLLKAVNAPSPDSRAEQIGFVDQKLTELARALAARPAVLLLDEPASGMEPGARERLAGVLRWVNEELETSMIIVEHDLAFLNSICDRLVVLERGRVVADGGKTDSMVLQTIDQIYHGTGGNVGVA
jgi:branched-chain amino acid transport system permease protein